MLYSILVRKGDNSFNLVYLCVVIKRISYCTSGFSSEMERVEKSISPALTARKINWTTADLRLLEPTLELMLHDKQPNQNPERDAPPSLHGKYRQVHAPSSKLFVQEVLHCNQDFGQISS